MTTTTFDSLGLSAKTLRAIAKIKYTAPMPVQAQVIPFVMQGRDVLASAQTGSGKTAAFTIPLLDIMASDETARCLVVAPTRELAEQIHKVFVELSQTHEDIKSALIVGGKHIGDQLKKLKKDPRFIIGTPGRINDHIKRKSLKLDTTKYAVWDETDRMLDLGFVHQIEHIIAQLPQDKQTLMFSATFPKRIVKLAEKYLKNPVRVEVDSLNSVSANITQQKIDINGDTKLQELSKLLRKLEGQVIVFAKTQRQVEKISKALVLEGQDTKPIHGGLRQQKRDSTMKAFRGDDFRILIATDVAARGLDIANISYVVNYELPQSPEEYIHRIGRTGRAEAKGTAISLVTAADKHKWKEIQAFLRGQEQQQSTVSQAKEEKILQANRNMGPFPVKREERISFKDKPSRYERDGGQRARAPRRDAAAPAPANTQVKKRFGFRGDADFTPGQARQRYADTARQERPIDVTRNNPKRDKPAGDARAQYKQTGERSMLKGTAKTAPRAEGKYTAKTTPRAASKYAPKRADFGYNGPKTYAEGNPPFKKDFGGSSKRKPKEQEQKKYGNGPAKRWAAVKAKQGKGTPPKHWASKNKKGR